MVRVNFNVDDNEYDTLKLLATIENKTIKDLMLTLINEYVEKNSERIAFLRRATERARNWTDTPNKESWTAM